MDRMLDGNRSESNQKVLILGAGGHARVCIETLRRMATFEIVGIAASDPKIGDDVLGVPVLARDTDIQDLYDRGFRFFVNGIGSASNHRDRGRLYLNLKGCGFYLPNLVHPSAAVDTSACLGDGNHVLAQSVVGSGARIANNCIVNSGAIVSHDVVLRDNVHVAPGAVLAGDVSVGSDTLIGMGVQVHMGVKIGSGVTIHNGCVVMYNVPDNAVVKPHLA